MVDKSSAPNKPRPPLRAKLVKRPITAVESPTAPQKRNLATRQITAKHSGSSPATQPKPKLAKRPITSETPNAALTEPAEKDQQSQSTDSNQAAKNGIDDPLITFAQEKCTFRRDYAGTTYADIPRPIGSGEHRWDTVPLMSGDYSKWFAYAFYKEHKNLPSPASVKNAIRALDSIVFHEYPPERTYRRFAYCDDKLYLDLANEKGEVIEGCATGWTVRDRSPVLFLRDQNMKALPTPERGGSVELLQQVVKLPRAMFILAIAWLIMALRGVGPFAILLLLGLKGSSKSTLSRIYRALIDPVYKSPMTSLSRREGSLETTAHNNAVVVLNNLGKISDNDSDRLCRIVTEGGSLNRKLNTDSGESNLDTHRPVIINGINMMTSRDDFLDRCLILHLPEIPPTERQTEAHIYRLLEIHHAKILGGLLDGCVSALRNKDSVQLAESPRLADFAHWVTAAEEGLGWEPGTFMEAYAANQKQVLQDSAEGSRVTMGIIEFMSTRDSWKGTMSRLLNRLRKLALNYGPLPRNVQGLYHELVRSVSALREHGITWSKGRSPGGKSRWVEITKVRRDEP